MEIREDSFFQQLGMQLGHPVDRWLPTMARWAMRTILTGPSSMMRKIAHFFPVARIILCHLIEKPPIDFIDDLQMPGQDSAHHINRPAFQGFRHQGMIGIGKGIDGNVPGFFPAQSFDIKQQPHQLRNGDGGMGIVELNGDQCVEFVRTGYAFS